MEGGERSRVPPLLLVVLLERVALEATTTTTTRLLGHALELPRYRVALEATDRERVLVIESAYRESAAKEPKSTT